MLLSGAWSPYREIHFNTKILYKKQAERLQESLSHVTCELYFGVVCGLIDNALDREKFIIII